MINSINLNILECKERVVTLGKANLESINLNILECKDIRF